MTAGRPWRHWLSLLLACSLLAACGGLPVNPPRAATFALPNGADTPLGRMVDQALATPPARAASAPAPAPAPIPVPATAAAAATAASVPAVTPRRYDSGFRLLGRADAAYTSRVALIDAAQKTLDLQYYTIQYDNSTVELLEHLQLAARRGVRVRILLDDFNAVGPNIEVLRLDREPGIEVRLFNPLSGSRRSMAGRVLGSLFDIKRAQQRMHNKVFIADNALAITGGRNLGDAYFGQGEDSNFVDLDVLAGGRIVRDLSRSFDRYWNHELAYPVQALLTPEEHARFEEPSPPPPARSPDAPASPPAEAPDSLAAEVRTGVLRLVGAPSVLYVDSPGKINLPEDADAPGSVVEDLLAVMDLTQRDLLIISPYFVPGERMMKTFATLRARGVRVRVLTNSLASTDAPLAHAGYARYRPALLQAGVELYELQPSGSGHRRLFGSATPSTRASLHSKALVLDGSLLVVGSMNLDLRSALQNTELGLILRSPALSSAVTRTVEQAFAESYRVQWVDGRLQWQAPPGSNGQPGARYDQEPEAGLGLRLLIQLVGPLAPDEVL